jgi:hypothetical protein
LLPPTFGLVVAVALFPPPTAAAPAARESTVTRKSEGSPKPRTELKLSPDARARLTAPTIKRKPVQFEALRSKDVRDVPANQRPVRRDRDGKLVPWSNTELADELNAIERRLNSQGYSLRSRGTVIHHEHQPDRAKLQAQDQRIRKVAAVKPADTPLTGDRLRARVRGSARPPVRRTLGSGAAHNGMWVQQGSGLHAESEFRWQPSIGEPETASAYVDTHVSFSGALVGSNPGLHGSAVIQAGAYVFGQRLDVARLESKADVGLDGSYDINVAATVVGGFEYHFGAAAKSLSIDQSLALFDAQKSYTTQLPLAGFQVELELTVSSSIDLRYDAELTDSYVFGGLHPQLRVDATAEVFVADSFSLIEAGVSGSVVLLDAKPDLWGYAYHSSEDGKPTLDTYVGGNMSMRLLEGRCALFLEAGSWPLDVRIEQELWDFEGWSYDFPLGEWQHASEP